MSVVVVVQVLNQVANVIHWQRVWVTVTVRIQRHGWIVWEWIGSGSTNHHCTVRHCQRSVTETITVGIRIPWVGSCIARIVVDASIGFIGIWNTIIVPIKIENVTDSVTILINRHIGCIQWIRTTVDFFNVAPSVVVIVRILFQWWDTCRRWIEVVWITVTIGIFPCSWVEWERIRSSSTVAGYR